MKKLLLILLVLGFVEAESGGIHRRHYRPSGDVVWWEIDALDAPVTFNPDANNNAILVLGSDVVVYQGLDLGYVWPGGLSGFDPSGGNLTPVFWSSQSEPAEWSAGDYAAGEAVKVTTVLSVYYYANSAATSSDVPGVSGVWTGIPAWQVENDYVAGIDWVDYTGGGAFYKCIIQSGPSTDFGAQDPGSPTQFWQVYTWQVWASGTTYALSDLALKTDYSAWYHSLFNGNIGHAIP